MVKSMYGLDHPGVSPQHARDAESGTAVFEFPLGVGASVPGAQTETRPIRGGFGARELSLGGSALVGVWDLAVGEGLLRSVGNWRGTGEQMYVRAAPGR
jgi:hypothetical protein